jgi:hypothetical protein
MRRPLLVILVVALVVVGGVAVWHVAYGGCAADRLPDTIGIYHRTSTELATLDPMPVASGVRMGPPQMVLELPGDDTCPALTGGSMPMGIWLKVSPNRYVLYGRGGGP